MPDIQHVVFDLGRVLVHFSYRQLFALLRRHGAMIDDAEIFAQQVDLIAYEHGRLSDAEFLARANALLTTPLNVDDLGAAWCEIFSPIPQMLQLMRRLRPAYRTYIISNTSGLHWQYLCERFALESLCDNCFPSCEVGHMKPAAEIYRLAEKRFGFAPQEAVFIDDRRENVDGAIACGWHGILHESYGETLERLHDMAVVPR